MNCTRENECYRLVEQRYVREYKSTNDNTVETNVCFVDARETNGSGTKADEKDAPPI